MSKDTGIAGCKFLKKQKPKKLSSKRSEAVPVLERCRAHDLVEFGRSTVIVDESDLS
jgi:hypothetical protein